MPEAGELFAQLEKQNQVLVDELAHLESRITANNGSTADLLKGLAWFENMTDYIALVTKMEEFMSGKLLGELNKHVSHYRGDFNMTIIAAIIIGLISPPLTAVYGYQTQKLNRRIREFTEKLKRKQAELQAERERAEVLLYQMLPVQVAVQLKAGNQIMPENFDLVTACFSDVYGFGQLIAISTPFEVSLAWRKMSQDVNTS